MAAYKRGVAKAKKKTAAPARAAAKPAAGAATNMGLGKLKGVYQERKQRLDRAIDEQTGARKRK